MLKKILNDLMAIVRHPKITVLDAKKLFHPDQLRSFVKIALRPVAKTSLYIEEHKNIAYHALAFDLAIAFFAIPIALFLRIGPEIVDYTIAYVFKLGFVYALCCFSFYSLFNTHHVMWRYFDSDDALRFVVSVSLAAFFFTPLKKLLSTTEELPRLTLLLAWILTLVTSLTPRFFSFFQHHQTKLKTKKKISLLIFGTDDKTEVFLKQIQQMEESEYDVVGLVSPRSDEIGLEIHHTNVVTSVRHFQKWLERHPALNSAPYKILLIEKDTDSIEKLLVTARIHGIQALRVPKSILFEEWTDLIPFQEKTSDKDRDLYSQNVA